MIFDKDFIQVFSDTLSSLGRSITEAISLTPQQRVSTRANRILASGTKSTSTSGTPSTIYTVGANTITEITEILITNTHYISSARAESIVYTIYMYPPDISPPNGLYKRIVKEVFESNVEILTLNTCLMPGWFMQIDCGTTYGSALTGVYHISGIEKTG